MSEDIDIRLDAIRDLRDKRKEIERLNQTRRYNIARSKRTIEKIRHEAERKIEAEKFSISVWEGELEQAMQDYYSLGSELSKLL